MAIETEIKFRISDSVTMEKLFSDPKIQEYQRATFHPIRMVSTYYDTNDGEANRRRWTLRLRMEDNTPVATIKTPAKEEHNGNLFSRNEWQTEAPSFEAAVPQLIALGAPEELKELVETSGLKERCKVAFIRQSTVLTLPDGVRIDMCIDKGEILVEEKTEEIFEVELELLFGDLSPMLDLAAYLSETYSLQKEYASKYERALRLIRSRR